jgi:hypothetical protein
MTNQIEGDLNTVIAHAVSARIEAQVAAALAGDDMIGRYVTAALTQEIQVGGSYEKRKTTFLKNTLDIAFQNIAKNVVARVLSEEAEAIEIAVRKELRANIATLASTLVGSVSKVAEAPYGISVELKYPGQ